MASFAQLINFIMSIIDLIKSFFAPADDNVADGDQQDQAVQQ